MTACGFCVVAALSSQISGRPLTRSRRIGKSRRIVSTSKIGRTSGAEAPETRQVSSARELGGRRRGPMPVRKAAIRRSRSGPSLVGTSARDAASTAAGVPGRASPPTGSRRRPAGGAAGRLTEGWSGSRRRGDASSGQAAVSCAQGRDRGIRGRARRSRPPATVAVATPGSWRPVGAAQDVLVATSEITGVDRRRRVREIRRDCGARVVRRRRQADRTVEPAEGGSPRGRGSSRS